MALAVRQDANGAFAADLDYTPLQTDALGALKVNVVTSVSPGQLIDDSAYAVGVDFVNPQGFLADETAPDSVDEGDIGIARMTLDRKVLFVGVDATVDSQRWTIDANNDLEVVIPTNSETNPLYVAVTNTVVSGSEIHDFNESVDVASDSTADHDYSVANAVFLLKQIIVSGSGSFKWELLVGPTATLVSKAVGFSTGRQGDTDPITFTPPIEVLVASIGIVRIQVTNRQGTAVSIYSTIIGNDV